MPMYDYRHVNGTGCVIGGYVFRSAQSKSLFGTYLFADFNLRWVKGLKEENGVLADPPITYLTEAQSPGYPISFGEDNYGDEYIIYNANGTLYKIVDTSYLRHPKAYYTSIEENAGATYLLQGLQGRNLTYQWLRNNVAIPGATSPDYDVNSNGNYSLVVTNDLGFSDTSDVFPFGALPLNLVSFTAQKISLSKIDLQWKTSSEQNVIGYNILRKQTNDLNFSKIGFAKSKFVSGTADSENAYSFIDSSAPVNSQLFYRLQIENKNGSSTYSDIRTITPDGDNTHFIFYPNPAHRKLHVELNGYNEPALLIIYDNKGQQVKKQIINEQSSTLDISGLRGFYIVQLSGTSGQNLIRKKLVVQ